MEELKISFDEAWDKVREHLKGKISDEDLSSVKDEVAKENNFQDWKDVESKYMSVLIHPLWSIVCLRYAEEVSKLKSEEIDLLQKAILKQNNILGEGLFAM